MPDKTMARARPPRRIVEDEPFGDEAGWVSGTARRDGLSVRQSLGSWVIYPAPGRPPITLCPCCDRPMQTPRAARRVADIFLPVLGSDKHG
jgi:hypothetical protein